MESFISCVVSGGKCGADVNAFRFPYDNMVISAKKEEDKAACLFHYLDGEARVSYRARFIFGWSLTEELRDYGAVCIWVVVVQQYARAVEHEELIWFAMDALLYKKNIVKSLSHMEEMYDKADFNDKAKY